jgi:hypothetical protein
MGSGGDEFLNERVKGTIFEESQFPPRVPRNHIAGPDKFNDLRTTAYRNSKPIPYLKTPILGRTPGPKILLSPKLVTHAD